MNSYGPGPGGRSQQVMFLPQGNDRYIVKWRNRRGYDEVRLVHLDHLVRLGVMRRSDSPLAQGRLMSQDSVDDLHQKLDRLAYVTEPELKVEPTAPWPPLRSLIDDELLKHARRVDAEDARLRQDRKRYGAADARLAEKLYSRQEAEPAKEKTVNENVKSTVQYTYEMRRRGTNEKWQRANMYGPWNDIEVMKKSRGVFGIGYGSDPQLEYRPVRISTKEKPLAVEVNEDLLELAEVLNKLQARKLYPATPKPSRGGPAGEGNVISTKDGSVRLVDGVWKVEGRKPTHRLRDGFSWTVSADDLFRRAGGF